MRKRTWRTQDVVAMLTKKHLGVNEAARLLGITRQAIWKRLKRDGIDLSGRIWVEVTCGFCGGEHRKRWKLWSSQNGKNYCSVACYAGARANPKFYYWRHGTRLARLIIGRYYVMQEGEVVHHKDGDDRNNDIRNLGVYANQSDHLKAHHGKSPVALVWDGATP